MTLDEALLVAGEESESTWHVARRALELLAAEVMRLRREMGGEPSGGRHGFVDLPAWGGAVPLREPDVAMLDGDVRQVGVVGHKEMAAAREAVAALLHACESCRECDPGQEPWDELCDAEQRVRDEFGLLGEQPRLRKDEG